MVPSLAKFPDRMVASVQHAFPVRRNPMSGIFYYLLIFAESIVSVFGVRFLYEQPRYAVMRVLDQDVEVRRYEPRLAIEATIQGTDREKAASEAFGLLFRYISGTNQGGNKVAMNAPVRTDTSPSRIAMTVPVETSATSPSSLRMRFFLPRSVAEAGAPAPLDPRLRFIDVPVITIAALRFSGVSTEKAQDEKRAVLLDVLTRSSLQPEGEVFLLNYDPPFAIPFLRRNEVAVKLAGTPAPAARSPFRQLSNRLSSG